MMWDWTPGERISKLPRLFRGPALIWRNLYFLPRNLRIAAQERFSLNGKAIRASLELSVEYITHAAVEGDVAEFGTMTGRTAVVLAKSLARHSQTKRLLLFDSFEGLPESQSSVDRESPHVRDGVWTPGACRGLTKKQLSTACRRYLPASRLAIYEGWFSQTLPSVPRSNRLALIHIDSDLYQSAIDVLDFCFAHQMVSRGAAIHFDDWDCNQANPELGERRAWSETVAKFDITFSDCGQYGWGCRKFLVHSYAGTQTTNP